MKKEDKDEIREGFEIFDFVWERTLTRAILTILVVVLVGGVCGYSYKKWSTNKEREIFKQSVAYTESAASFLADSYKQYNETEDTTQKKVIMQYVVMRYPNLDTDTIDNVNLKQFYIKCLKGEK